MIISTPCTSASRGVRLAAGASVQESGGEGLVRCCVQARLACGDAQAHGWLLDGYPRSAEQAEAIEEAGIRPDIFILIEARP